MPDPANKPIDADTSGAIPAVTTTDNVDRDMRNLVEFSSARFEAAARRVNRSSSKLQSAVMEAKRSISGEMPALVPPGGKLSTKKVAP
jgi:hypothetical protein